ncbi:MAG: response regulator [Pseudomonadota bacterium]
MTSDASFFRAQLAERHVEQLEIALWVFDMDAQRVVWANRAALKVWAASSIEELQARDLGKDMSASVENRLAQYRADFEAHDSRFSELWTLYPEGRPTTLRVRYSGFRLEDGRIAMLCEARPEKMSTPEALRSSEALLHSSVIITMCSPRGDILYCNPAARECYGGHVSQVQDRFRGAEAWDDFTDRLMRELQCDLSLAVETTNGPRWHDIHARLCRDAVTGEQSIVLSEHDVTEERAAKAAMEASRNEALKANQLKTEFLANMSHEIRTPLNGVLGMAQLLEDTALDADQRSFVTTIRSSGGSLLGLIEDILDISRIEAGMMALETTPFTVRDIAERAIDAVTGVALQKQLALDVALDAPDDLEFNGDARRIRQVLINLLGNAVKFTASGRVTLSAAREGAAGLRFAVADTGPGVPPDQRAAIFERFRQADGSNTRVHGGAGLGLSICKDLIEMMGGAIGVETAPGGGALFWCTIPDLAPRQRGEALRPERRRAAAAALDQAARVLVVEDNRVNQQILQAALTTQGYRIDIAENGQEAIERLQERAFDIVLMDLQMPVMTGREAIQWIRGSDQPFADVPIVALTADAERSTRDACLNDGADDFLTKPVDVQGLYAVVSRLVGEMRQSA